MKYVKIPLYSARRNPDKNVKLSIVDQLKPFYEKDKNNKVPKYFISFTDLPKLGINPSYKYDTPLGVYGYPIKYVWDKLVTNSIDFAGKRPFVQVLERTTNKVIDNSYTWESYPKDVEKLRKYVNKIGANINFEELKEESESKVIDPDSAVYNIWFLGHLLSMDLSEFLKRKASYIWNTLLVRVLGYECSIDYEGEGFIHPNEPVQGVFLTKNSYKHLDMLSNKRYDGEGFAKSGKLNLFAPRQIGYPENTIEYDRVERLKYLSSFHPNLLGLKGNSIITIFDPKRIKICGGYINSNVKNISFVDFEGKPLPPNESKKINVLIYPNGPTNLKVEACDIGNLNAYKCDIIDSIIRNGIFKECNFINCKWINGSYTYDSFTFENSKMSPNEIAKKYPTEKLTEILYRMVVEQASEELLDKEKKDITDKDLGILYKLTKKRFTITTLDLSELAELTKSEKVIFNK